jgi:hypothetical protein
MQMKWLKRGLIGLAVLLALLVVGVWLWGDAAARKGVEMGGTAALGVPTKLDSVSLGWLSGSVAIHGLKVGNPEGYQTDRLMGLGHGKVACDIPSLLGDEVVVREILIDEPELTIELKPSLPFPKSNLGDLLSSLKSKDQAAPAKKEEAKPATGEGKKFRVDLIRIHLLMGKTADVVLPDIELKEVRNTDGTLPRLADIFRQVLVAMSTSAFRNAKGIVPADMLGGLGDAVAGTQKLIGGGLKVAEDTAGMAIRSTSATAEEVTKTVSGAAEGATKAAGDVGKGVGGTIKSIFGKKKKKTE